MSLPLREAGFAQWLLECGVGTVFAWSCFRMSDLAGLERALGAAGIALDERGSPVAASEATPPANSAAVEFRDAGVTPPAAANPETATDTGDERMSLDEFAEALSGQVAPDPVAGQQAAPQSVAVATPVNMTAREIELQKRVDEMAAKIAEAELEDKIAAHQGQWDLRWNEGQDYYEQNLPRQVVAEVQRMAQDKGWSDLEVERAKANGLLWAKDQHRIWNETFSQNERADPLLRKDAYAAPDLATQLIEQYGLRAETRSALAKYANNPDLMKDVAATIAAHTGAEVQQIRQRDADVTTAARTQVAQHLQNGISPNAPNVAVAKLPPDWSKVDKHEAASFWASQARNGSLGRA